MSWLREEVLRRADIVEVVSEYIPLKKRGGNYWALSPFKPEKTPSFAVSPSKQIFKCFSSGKGGDVIRFVMEMEGLSYGEALRKLAEKYDIDINNEKESSFSSKEKQRYLSLYGEAARFYQNLLAGSPAESYLSQRGIGPDILQAFGLGYAPGDGQSLTRYFLQLGYAEDTLVEWGLSIRPEGGGRIYDRFRERLIFPITDEQGAVIAFAGRVLDAAKDQPKYLNSPETPFYQKSEILYGLHQAKASLKKGKAALIVEGYMDVLSLHQGGFTEAIATCGTALTEGHLTRLRRYTRELILFYDNDEAGQAAAERALFPALSAGFFVRIAQVPSGKDPDEFYQAEGAQAMERLLTESTSWPLFLAARTPESASPQQRYHLLQKLGQCLQALPDPLMRRVYAEEIADKLHIPPDFWESFERVEGASRRSEVWNPPRITAERELLRMALLYPEVEYGGIPLWHLLREELQHMTFSEAPAEQLRQLLCQWPHPSPPSLSDLSEHLSPEIQDWAAGLLMEKYALSEHWREWDDTPLEEDPLHITESNLHLLHLSHLQHLLTENLRILETLSPDEPAYEEHMTLHQVLLRQRTELAHRQGLLLPYRKSLSDS